MTLVEKMARAIAMGSGTAAGEWQHFTAPALLALKAMRELTPATMEATVSAFNDYESAFETSEETVTRILGSLIDAALKEAGSG